MKAKTPFTNFSPKLNFKIKTAKQKVVSRNELKKETARSSSSKILKTNACRICDSCRSLDFVCLRQLSLKLLRRNVAGCSEFFAHCLNKILEQKSSTEYIQFLESQADEQSPSFSKYYKILDFRTKFQTLYKFCKFMFFFPKLYNLNAYQTVKEYIYLRRKKREKTMRKILEEMHDSEMHLLTIDYVIVCENTCKHKSLKEFLSSRTLSSKINKISLVHNKKITPNALQSHRQLSEKMDTCFNMDNSRINENISQENASNFLSESYFNGLDPVHWSFKNNASLRSRIINPKFEKPNLFVFKKKSDLAKTICANFTKPEGLRKKSATGNSHHHKLNQPVDKNDAFSGIKANSNKFCAKPNFLCSKGQQFLKNNSVSEVASNLTKMESKKFGDKKDETKNISQKTVMKPLLKNLQRREIQRENSQSEQNFIKKSSADFQRLKCDKDEYHLKLPRNEQKQANFCLDNKDRIPKQIGSFIKYRYFNGSSKDVYSKPFLNEDEDPENKFRSKKEEIFAECKVRGEKAIGEKMYFSSRMLKGNFKKEPNTENRTSKLATNDQQCMESTQKTSKYYIIQNQFNLVLKSANKTKEEHQPKFFESRVSISSASQKKRSAQFNTLKSNFLKESALASSSKNELKRQSIVFAKNSKVSRSIKSVLFKQKISNGQNQEEKLTTN